VFVDRSVLEYAVNLVLCTRTPENFGLPELRTFIELGASPRASLGLIRGGRALALLRGRSYLTPQDVFDVAPEIMRHRMLLSYEALAQDVDVEQILARILGTVPAPRLTPVQNGGDPYYGSATDAAAWNAATAGAPAGAGSAPAAWGNGTQ
jgi:MoxR-like ATPase